MPAGRSPPEPCCHNTPAAAGCQAIAIAINTASGCRRTPKATSTWICGWTAPMARSWPASTSARGNGPLGSGKVLAFPQSMRYLALACDYDGTLATDGHVSEATLRDLRRLRDSGRRLILVSGRELEDLLSVFADIGLFDLAVLENGGILYRPSDQSVQTLAEPASEALAGQLQERGVAPVSMGRTIIATWEPHETAVLEAIHELGLEIDR